MIPQLIQNSYTATRAASSVLTSLSPSRTAVTSFSPKCQNFEEGDWVLGLAGSPGSIACAVSNGVIQIYDPQRLHLIHSYPKPQQSHDSSTVSVTNLTYASSGNDTCNNSSTSSSSSSNLLWVTNSLGEVRVYDVRQPSVSGYAQLPAPTVGGASACQLPAWDVALGYQGTVAAVASKRKIFFLDVRQLSNSLDLSVNGSGWVGCYKDGHTDHVTRVRFHDTVLFSGGEDGLVAAFDTTQPNEAEALQTVWNVGSPVRQLGTALMQDQSASSPPTVWCLTGSETVAFWNPQSDEAHHFHQAREELSTLSHIPLQYLVDAHWDDHGRDLWLTAGNGQGDAAVFRLVNPPANKGEGSHLRWDPCHVLSGGHRGVVRGICHYSPNIWFTAGEDARLCEWSRWGQHRTSQATSAPSTNATRSTNVSARPAPQVITTPTGGGPVRRQRHRTNMGPY